MTPPRKLPPLTSVRIDRMGAEGDGIGRLPDGTFVYVPLSLPGEQISARPVRRRADGWQAMAEAIEVRSPARVEPPCQHFGRCGGCVLQHWGDAAYRAWKAGLLSFALRQAGFVVPDPMPFLPGLPGERRRIDFAVRRVTGRIILGLHGVRSPDVVDLTDCLVLHPTLMGLIRPLRILLLGLKAVRQSGSVVINLLESGPDMLLRTDGDLSFDDRTALTGFAAAHGLARVSCAAAQDSPETIGLLRPATTSLSGVTVRPPPGGFLQATVAGEQAIVQAVIQALPPRMTARTRVAELYAGCGTLTFALAPHVRVAAWEGDAATVAALRQAVNQAQLGGRIEATQRDLARQPVSMKELAGFAAVVLDPPQAGAAAQIGQIAAARVPTVIYVNCNPATLARDARVLLGAGYVLSAATAIDQFLWSSRLESVCVFQSTAVAPRRRAV